MYFYNSLTRMHTIKEERVGGFCPQGAVKCDRFQFGTVRRTLAAALVCVCVGGGLDGPRDVLLNIL